MVKSIRDPIQSRIFPLLENSKIPPPLSNTTKYLHLQIPKKTKKKNNFFQIYSTPHLISLSVLVKIYIKRIIWVSLICLFFSRPLQSACFNHQLDEVLRQKSVSVVLQLSVDTYR